MILHKCRIGGFYLFRIQKVPHSEVKRDKAQKVQCDIPALKDQQDAVTLGCFHIRMLHMGGLALYGETLVLMCTAAS